MYIWLNFSNLVALNKNMTTLLQCKFTNSIPEIGKYFKKSGKKSYNQGMELFATRFNPQSLYIIGTDGIPLEQFLSMDPEELL